MIILQQNLILVFQTGYLNKGFVSHRDRIFLNMIRDRVIDIVLQTIRK